MDGPSRGSETASRDTGKADPAAGLAGGVQTHAGDPGRAALGPVPEPVSAAANALPAAPADSPAEALGRRTLSTAFVRVGPDGHLTVELRDGRVLVLRNVAMRPVDYCGVQVSGGRGGAKFCGSYADVAAARPGGGPAAEAPDPAVADPLQAAPRRSERG